MDTLSRRERSARMSLVRNKDTKPEMIVRRMVHAMGFRYRLHAAKIPGRPDLVFNRRRKLIFIHGCFWHQHPSLECHLARMPKSRQEFWSAKLLANRARDAANMERLLQDGWRVLTIWECELRDKHLPEKIRRFLEP